MFTAVPTRLFWPLELRTTRRGLLADGAARNLPKTNVTTTIVRNGGRTGKRHR
jgi:hypothetical protein